MTNIKRTSEKRAEKSSEPSVAPEPAPEPTTQLKEVAFSVRLTAEEHELLKQAAAVRGWTATNLIRTAALDRALHILNTSQVTTFNFKGLAVTVANQLFQPRDYSFAEIPDQFDEPKRVWLSELDPMDPNSARDLNLFSVRADLEALPINNFAELKKAARLGGGEFLNLILEYCEFLTASKRGDVPDPLEPKKST